MLNYTLRRALYAIPVLLVASFLIFWAVRDIGDPCLRARFSHEQGAAQRCEENLGLNDPIPVQYWKWLDNALHGDLGESSRTHQPVIDMFPSAMWNTTQLLLWGTLLSLTLAISLGVYSAVKQYSVGDYAFTALSFIGLAMPAFWFGLLAQQLLAVGLKEKFGLDQPIFYIVGLHSVGESGFNMDYLRHLALPVLTLTVQGIASWSRFQRATMLDVLSADYIRTARAKGVPRRRVIWSHGVRNALIPLVTVVAIDTGALFGGLIITETIFSIPGMGRLFFDSLNDGDVNVIVPWTIITAFFVILFNLVADILYGVLDPRVRIQ
jgi:peptide/nickel transport system permease protein